MQIYINQWKANKMWTIRYYPQIKRRKRWRVIHGWTWNTMLWSSESHAKDRLHNYIHLKNKKKMSSNKPIDTGSRFNCIAKIPSEEGQWGGLLKITRFPSGLMKTVHIQDGSTQRWKCRRASTVEQRTSGRSVFSSFVTTPFWYCPSPRNGSNTDWRNAFSTRQDVSMLRTQQPL